MKLAAELIWIAIVVAALVITLKFWWVCVKIAWRDLMPDRAETPQERDAKHEHNQRREDD